MGGLSKWLSVDVVVIGLLTPLAILIALYYVGHFH